MSVSLYTRAILRRVAAGERLFVRHRSWSAAFYISSDVWDKPEWLDGEQIIADLTHVKGEILGREILKWKYIKSHNVYNGDDCVIDEYKLTEDGVAFIENLYTTPPDSSDGGSA